VVTAGKRRCSRNLRGDGGEREVQTMTAEAAPGCANTNQDIKSGLKRVKNPRATAERGQEGSAFAVTPTVKPQNPPNLNSVHMSNRGTKWREGKKEGGT